MISCVVESVDHMVSMLVSPKASAAKGVLLTTISFQPDSEWQAAVRLCATHGGLGQMAQA